MDIKYSFVGSSGAMKVKVISLVESVIFLQVISIYMNVDIQEHYLSILFLITFLWGCATFAVVFYGVDSVDLAGKVDLRNKENFQWINVSQISFFFFKKILS